VSTIVGGAKAAELKSMPPIYHWLTKNGIPVYFVARSQIPVIDMSIIFRAGSAYDGTLPGIAQFTAQMLNQGTRNLNADQIANRFESVGAHYSAMIHQDGVTLRLRSLSESKFFNSAFSMFVELVGHANFPQTAVNRTRKQIEIALQEEEQTPSLVARNAFYKMLYGQHPYASPLLGTMQSVQEITREKLIDFYQHYYVNKNAVIVMVGDMTKDRAVALAEQFASALTEGKQAVLPSLPVKQPVAHLYKIHYPSQQTTILLGQIGITLKDPDYFSILLGNQILGGGILTSRLFSEIRNKRGLCYGISSYFDALQTEGPFVINLKTRADQAFTALSLTQSTLKNFVVHGPTEAELLAAKQTLIGNFPLTIASNASILAHLEKIGFYELPLTYLDNYRANLSHITVQQVHSAFQKHIKPDKLLVIMVGKT